MSLTIWILFDTWRTLQTLLILNILLSPEYASSVLHSTLDKQTIHIYIYIYIYNIFDKHSLLSNQHVYSSKQVSVELDRFLGLDTSKIFNVKCFDSLLIYCQNQFPREYWKAIIYIKWDFIISFQFINACRKYRLTEP